MGFIHWYLALNRKSSFLLFGLFLMSQILPSLAEGESLGDTANVIRAQGEFMVDVAEARLKYAQSAFIDAKTAQEVEKANFLHQAFLQYQLELKKANMARRALETQAASLDGRIHTFNTLMMGLNTGQIWDAYRFLYMNAITIDARLAAEAIVVPVEARDKLNFVGAPFDFSGETIGDLFDWLERSVQFHIGVRPNSKVMRVILQAVSVMAKPAADKLTQLQVAAKNLKPEDSTLWKPGDLLALVNGERVLGSTTDGKPPNVGNMVNIIKPAGG